MACPILPVHCLARGLLFLSNSFSTLASLSSDDLGLASPVAASSPIHKAHQDSMITGEKRKKWSHKPKLLNVRKSGQMKVMVLNFQSVKNKVAELAICLDTQKPDVLIGTESWLSSGISNSEIFPPDYSVIRKDRPPSSRALVMVGYLSPSRMISLWRIVPT